MKNIINKAYIRLCRFSKSTKWERILTEKQTQIFDLKKHKAYKVESILDCSISPFDFCSDIHNYTRQQWDNFLNITIHKTLNDDIADVEVFGVRGLYWKNNQKQICIFQSESILYGVWVKMIDEKKFFVCEIIVCLLEKEPVLEKLTERMSQLLWAVTSFPTLYDPITCHGCRKRLPSWCLECNREECKVERFGRCKDLQCYLPSQKKDQEKCNGCGGDVENIKF
jgi:hypothetical protein